MMLFWLGTTERHMMRLFDVSLMGWVAFGLCAGWLWRDVHSLLWCLLSRSECECNHEQNQPWGGRCSFFVMRRSCRAGCLFSTRNVDLPMSSSNPEGFTLSACCCAIELGLQSGQVACFVSLAPGKRLLGYITPVVWHPISVPKNDNCMHGCSWLWCGSSAFQGLAFVLRHAFESKPYLGS